VLLETVITGQTRKLSVRRNGDLNTAYSVSRRHDLTEHKMKRAKTRKGTADHNGSDHTREPEPHRIDHHTGDYTQQRNCSNDSVMNLEF
jgi:hypothetical protein